MSSFDRERAGAPPGFSLLAISLLACLLLSGCGFRPLYGANGASHAPAVAAQFASIQIPPLPDRIGQEMRNKLIDSLHASGPDADFKYRLTVRVREADLNLGLQQNSTSTRGQVKISAEYWLTEADSGKTLLHETLRTSTGYNILVNQFGSVLSNDDARDRGLDEISDEMTTHLALYFNTKS
jgi:LPS-assembly lipoprotein